MATPDRVHPDALLLLNHPDVLAAGAAARERIIRSGHPLNDGDADGDDADADAGDGDDAAAGDDSAAAAGPGDGDQDDDAGAAAGAQGGKEPDWKAMARKHEARAKKVAKELEAERSARADREAAELSEHEKAVKDAREAGRAEALTESEKTRRADKLEIAVTRLAASRGIVIGTGEDAKTVKFSDPDDVQMWLDRQIAKGAIDVDDIYVDGKVDTDALTEALVELATDKPGWLAGSSTGPARKAAGDPDAGKGAKTKGMDDLSVEDLIKRKMVPR